MTVAMRTTTIANPPTATPFCPDGISHDIAHAAAAMKTAT